MPPKKRKVSFSPAEEHIGSLPPAKKRSYTKKIPAATAVAGRPKRGEIEESARETDSKSPILPKSKITPSTSGKPSSFLSSEVSAAQVTPKRGRGRPKKVVDDGSTQTLETSVKVQSTSQEGTEKKRGRGRPKKVVDDGSALETPSVKVQSKPQEGTEKKRGPGRPRKAVKETNFVKRTSAAELQGDIEDNSVDYDDKDLKDSRSYWLMKAEPETRFEKGVDVRFSIDDLRGCLEPEPWDGVRNPGARNNMRAMRKGDIAFFYHSNCKVPGIAGVMEIVQEHSIDETAFDTSHPYHDPRSDPKNPKWDLVHVEFRRKFKNLVGLAELKSYGKPGGVLESLQTLKQTRLSVSAVTAKQWKFIMSLVDNDGE